MALLEVDAAQRLHLLPAGSGGTTRSTGESPLEILDRRLAGGEIDLDAWQAHRAALLAARADAK